MRKSNFCGLILSGMWLATGSKGGFMGGPNGHGPAPPKPDTPEAAATYTVADLTGTVIGTDGYERAIGLIEDEDAFTTDGQTARLQLGVPGAQAMIRDVVTVSSKLLAERQEIEILFSSRKRRQPSD